MSSSKARGRWALPNQCTNVCEVTWLLANVKWHSEFPDYCGSNELSPMVTSPLTADIMDSNPRVTFRSPVARIAHPGLLSVATP